MSRQDDLQRVLDRGIVAIVRAPTSEGLCDVARALYDGGIDIIEITCTVPNALETISNVRADLGEKILLGAGTVLDAETARAAILAGAQFVVSPVVDRQVVELCHRYDKLVMPGAMTPTEVLAAWESGADVVKLFPAEIGGPTLLKAIRGPLPHVRLLPTGGVNLNTLRDFVQAGACAVGLGSALVERDAVLHGDMERIRDLAEQFTALMQTVRSELAG
jgi:2-dehydro-3-deoxyphosphogluconate aldolase/(4S)-4-hydroxy-2-oxoglutarate aldolase